MFRRVLASSVLAACFGAIVLANHPATFVLRNGDRVSGELSYKGGTAYTLDGKDYPSSDIALIAFVPGDPTAAELNQIPTVDDNPSEHERHVFVTRGGEVIFGKIYKISPDGNTFTFDRREGGRQDIASDLLARVYVNPAGARTVYASVLSGPTTRTAEAVGTSGTTITVLANQAWTDTGITVNQGDRVSFQASGQISYGRGANMTASPDGGAERRAQYPDPSVPVGALIGRVGNGKAFGIGTQAQPLAMPGAGRLFLGVNDNELTDNSGSFTVVVTRQ